MSHLKERKEKNCLNCNAQLEGRYCHICGQENVETKESAWHLVTHFFQDITHYDGKFFSTLRLLITRPGFLAAEYMRGRRASYLNPVRMYVFTSAFFFLIFFTVFNHRKESAIADIDWQVEGKTYPEVMKMDSADFAEFTRSLNRKMGKDTLPMTMDQFRIYYDSVVTGAVSNTGRAIVNITGMQADSKARYDSLLRTGELKDGWLVRSINYKQLEINQRYRGRGKDLLRDFGDAFLHKLPQLLFVSLPLLALLLKILYRHHRQYYYADHGIFSIQLYIFVFIALLVQIGLARINEQLHWGLIDFTRQLIGLGIFFYLYRAMRNFYHQGRGKTMLKFLLVCFLFLLIMLVLMFIFLIFSVLSI